MFALMEWFMFLMLQIPSLYMLMQIPNDKFKGVLYKSLVLSAVVGYLLTDFLVPIISKFTLNKGLYGKDLGKKGTEREQTLVPEALGLVPATCFLICAILSQLLFAQDTEDRLLYTSALFSVCFMIFLGFCDDTLDLAWRYKLVLPTIASLPLLASYSGESALYVPSPLRFLLVEATTPQGTLVMTPLAKLLDLVFVVDASAGGAIVELGVLTTLTLTLTLTLTRTLILTLTLNSYPHSRPRYGSRSSWAY